MSLRSIPQHERFDWCSHAHTQKTACDVVHEGERPVPPTPTPTTTTTAPKKRVKNKNTHTHTGIFEAWVCRWCSMARQLLTAVVPLCTASRAYSTWNRWPSGLNTVIARSYLQPSQHEDAAQACTRKHGRWCTEQWRTCTRTKCLLPCIGEGGGAGGRRKLSEAPDPV